MDRTEQLATLAGVAADQWGLVTTAQAKQAGVGRVQLLRLAEAGLIESVAHGVYLLAAAGQPPHLEIKVAWLRLDPAVPAWQRAPGASGSGVISHTSACVLHGLGDIPAPKVEISVPRRRTTSDPFVHLRVAAVPPSQITVVEGLPVTTAIRTIIDLLRTKADGGHVGGVIAEADRQGLVVESELAAAVQPFARAYGLEPTADGEALLRHLVVQAGSMTHSQELERAAQVGFAVAALQLADPQGTLAEQTTRRMVEALQTALPTAALVQQMQDYVASLGIAANLVQAALPKIDLAPHMQLAEALKGFQAIDPKVLEALRAPLIDATHLAKLVQPFDSAAFMKALQEAARPTTGWATYRPALSAAGPLAVTAGKAASGQQAVTQPTEPDDQQADEGSQKQESRDAGAKQS